MTYFVIKNLDGETRVWIKTQAELLSQFSEQGSGLEAKDAMTEIKTPAIREAYEAWNNYCRSLDPRWIEDNQIHETIRQALRVADLADELHKVLYGIWSMYSPHDDVFFMFDDKLEEVRLAFTKLQEAGEND